MLRVVSDALTAADARQVTLIALLDLTAAFDCVDHALLLRRLQYNFGFTDDVLRWMTSSVTDRTQQVSYDGQLSPIHPVQFGVPQGSVLGPLLFVLYTQWRIQRGSQGAWPPRSPDSVGLTGAAYRPTTSYSA